MNGRERGERGERRLGVALSRRWRVGAARRGREARAEEGERGDGLLRWLTTAAPAALRSKADGSVGVFALEDVAAWRTLDFSMKRVDEIVRGSPLVGE